MSIFTHSLVFERGPRAGRRLPFAPSQMTLGRATQCDIAIADPLLSRTHCRFELRGGDLWIVDLESANWTMVNDIPIAKESRLHFGDIVTAGESVIRIERAEEGGATASRLAEEPPLAPAAEVVIDLGFDKDDDSGAAPKKNFLRPLIWLVAGILVLGAGVKFFQNSSSGSDGRTTGPRPVAQDNTLQVYYEKIKATSESIFRYELSLTADGMWVAKIDDLSGNGRHVSKEKRVEQVQMTELVRDFEGSGFFALNKTYTGYALNPNTLNESLLVVAVGKKVHTCRVTNRSDEPEGFRAAREKLETFVCNELELWDTLYPVDELIELAQNALDIARKRYEEKDVKYGNLYEALGKYKAAVSYLDTVNPKPEFYTEVLDGFDTAKEDLEKRYKNQKFLADQAGKLSEWAKAVRELKIICEMIPERNDPRHVEAMGKLLDAERRMKNQK